MDVIALIDDIKIGVATAKFSGIGCHAHSGWWNAVSRHALQVVAVRNPADFLVMGSRAEGAGNPLAFNTLRPETDPTLAASDLLLLPMSHGRSDFRP